MNMTTVHPFQVPTEHVPGFIALIATPLVLWAAINTTQFFRDRNSKWATRMVNRYDASPFTAKLALSGTFVGAFVHIVLVPTHWADERSTALLFIIDTLAFGFAFVWTLALRRRWQLIDFVILAGTAATYAFYILTGREDADLVGILTSTIELSAALLVASPRSSTAAAVGRHAVKATAIATAISLFSLLSTAAIANATPLRISLASMQMPKQSTSMPMAPMSSSTTSISLPTSSPAGPITWPYVMTSMEPGMQMVTADCTATPTVGQQTAAVDLVNQTVAATAPYQSLAAAKAAGYVPLSSTDKASMHYINPKIYRQGPVLDPTQIPVLVYANTPHGAVLSAAMYLLPKGMTTPPQPGGCLTEWHEHTNICFQGGKSVGHTSDGSCPEGGINRITQPMMHVWLVPTAGGPLAPDPSSAQVREAASKMPPLVAPNGRA